MLFSKKCFPLLLAIVLTPSLSASHKKSDGPLPLDDFLPQGKTPTLQFPPYRQSIILDHKGTAHLHIYSLKKVLQELYLEIAVRGLAYRLQYSVEKCQTLRNLFIILRNGRVSHNGYYLEEDVLDTLQQLIKEVDRFMLKYHSVPDQAVYQNAQSTPSHHRLHFDTNDLLQKDRLQSRITKQQEAVQKLALLVYRLEKIEKGPQEAYKILMQGNLYQLFPTGNWWYTHLKTAKEPQKLIATYTYGSIPVVLQGAHDELLTSSTWERISHSLLPTFCHRHFLSLSLMGFGTLIGLFLWIKSVWHAWLGDDKIDL